MTYSQWRVLRLLITGPKDYFAVRNGMRDFSFITVWWTVGWLRGRGMVDKRGTKDAVFYSILPLGDRVFCAYMMKPPQRLRGAGQAGRFLVTLFFMWVWYSLYCAFGGSSFIAWVVYEFVLFTLGGFCFWRIWKP